jgi:hypothetical protein
VIRAGPTEIRGKGLPEGVVVWCGASFGSTIRWMKDKGWSEVYRALVACNSDCLALMFDDRSQYKLVGLHDCPRRRKLMTVWRDCVA